jgi:hypothetical protein
MSISAWHNAPHVRPITKKPHTTGATCVTLSGLFLSMQLLNAIAAKGKP